MKLSRVSRYLVVGIACLCATACDSMNHNGMDHGSAMADAPKLPKNLIHRYSFANGAKDSAGKIDGVLKGDSAKIADGKLTVDNGTKSGGDAGVSYLEFPSSILPKAADASASASIVFWFTGTNTQSFSRLVDFGDREGVQGRAFIYFTPHFTSGGASGSRVAITADTTGSKTNTDGALRDDGKEHMVAIAIDGKAKMLHMYVDGKEPEAAKRLGANTLDKVKPNFNWIGRSLFDQDGAITATVNEFRVYDTALSSAEVSAAATAGPDVVVP